MVKSLVVPIDRLELNFAPRSWSFADQRRAEIAAYFAQLRCEKPALWNGRVLVLHDYAITGRTFRGEFFETGYADLLAWRDWHFPDPSVKNCFAMGAIRAADGGFLLGVMGSHTASAGAVYFPAGTIDPTDVTGSRVDFEGSVWREVAEETGLTAADLIAEPNWHAVLAGPRIPIIKILHARENANDLRARILEYLAREQQPELTDIHIVRNPADVEARVAPFVSAFLSHIWALSDC